MPQPDPLLARLVLKYGLAPAVVSTVAAYKLWRIRRHLRSDAALLKQWATDRGWRIGDANDPLLLEELASMNGLLAEEGTRSYGIVIVGNNAVGKVIVAETYRADPGQSDQAESGASVDIVYAATYSGEPTMCTVTAGGWLVPSRVVRFLDGPSPTPSQAAMMNGLAKHSRLAVLPGRILLRRPGYLAPSEADRLLERLQQLAEAQRSPGSAPNR